MRLISYDIELVSQSGSVSPKYCEGIILENVGDVDATLNGVPFPAGSITRNFDNNHPGDVIKNAFALVFKSGTLGTNPLVAVTRKYVAPIPANEECNYKR